MAITSKVYKHLRTMAHEKSRGMNPDLFEIRGLWSINYRYRPNRFERDLSYSITIAQTLLQGACYVDYGASHIDETLLSGDARYAESSDVGLTIAMLDAVYSAFSSTPDRSFEYSGNADEKARRRAEIICEEVAHQLAHSKRKRVLNVGVMGNFFPVLKNMGIEVLGSDFEEELLRSGLPSSPEASIHHGSKTLDLIDDVDVVLATGMTMTTGTLDEIIDRVKQSRKKLVLFAATGAYLGQSYCAEFGVDAVVSEYQPQYMFQGTSRIDVFRCGR